MVQGDRAGQSQTVRVDGLFPGREVSFEIEPDRWLASVMGRPAYTVRCVQAGGAEAAHITARLSEERAFATAKVPADDIGLTNILVDAGFRVVDVTLTFSKNAGVAQACGSVREATTGDEGSVREIARSAFRYSRFHLDPLISNELANTIKMEWAGNFFKGLRGNAMLVAEMEGAVGGFCQLIVRNGDAIVDLIAVKTSFSRRGLARKLLAGVTVWAENRNISIQRLVVGTQAANTASVNLYESLGFRLASSTLVLHFTAP